MSTEFGTLLKRCRVDRLLKQSEVAASAGLDISYVSLLESGGRLPRLATAIQLAKALGESPVSFAVALVNDELEAAGEAVRIR